MESLPVMVTVVVALAAVVYTIYFYKQGMTELEFRLLRLEAPRAQGAPPAKKYRKLEHVPPPDVRPELPFTSLHRAVETEDRSVATAQPRSTEYREKAVETDPPNDRKRPREDHTDARDIRKKALAGSKTKQDKVAMYLSTNFQRSKERFLATVSDLSKKGDKRYESPRVVKSESLAYSSPSEVRAGGVADPPKPAAMGNPPTSLFGQSATVSAAPEPPKPSLIQPSEKPPATTPAAEAKPELVSKPTSLFGSAPVSSSGASDTSTQPAPSLFGSVSKPEPKGASLFGDSKPQALPSDSTLLFGGPRPTEPVTTSLFAGDTKANSLFTQTEPKTTPAVSEPKGTSLFSVASDSKSPSLFPSAGDPKSSSLFSSASDARTSSLFPSSDPKASSLFASGDLKSTSPLPASTSSSLFGSAESKTPSVFGGVKPPANESKETSLFTSDPKATQLFGAIQPPAADVAAVPSEQKVTSLFALPVATDAKSTSLFGQSTEKPPSDTKTTSLFGASTGPLFGGSSGFGATGGLFGTQAAPMNFSGAKASEGQSLFGALPQGFTMDKPANPPPQSLFGGPVTPGAGPSLFGPGSKS